MLAPGPHQQNPALDYVAEIDEVHTCDHGGDPGGGIFCDRRHTRMDVRSCACVHGSTDCKTL